ncbi:M20 metallopeptidase family protein [Murimonas intestini]|uniref:Amidohydrolase n=1 Tax=Murimonas intestini TaxID=1337051 RepID=A0AB73SYA1_9FIRM|nr:M20 family metallopeptidase [Murimonas intestini]MCR1868372.1 M20 family metallopeptidase [Murimonas intestini]MCR1885816.1 M20 family metallopeptidase [Murimonas intestini]
MYSSIYAESKEMYDELIEWRRELHKVPELGLELPKTVSFVKEKLTEWDIPFETKINGNCVIGYIGTGDKCLLLRADMDGLPMNEESQLSFASQNGNMHACGHDIHTTALLGAAKILKKHEKDLKGRIKLLFQPGEETFEGAKAVIAEGVLENPKVNAAFATHVASVIPVGTIAYGTMTGTSVFGFKITITGKGTHGAMPQNGIDPINVGVHIYQALQELIARECPPGKEVTLTIGQFNSGTANNIIPETAILQGTLRTFDSEIKQYLITRIEEIVNNISNAFHAESKVDVLTDIPVLCCDEKRNMKIAKALNSMNTEFNMVSGLHTTGSDDFAVFANKVPSSYFMIGAKVDSDNIYAHHNPKVCFNEQVLPIETAVYACVAMDWE